MAKTFNAIIVTILVILGFDSLAAKADTNVESQASKANHQECSGHNGF